MLDSLRQDLSYALRRLRQASSFTTLLAGYLPARRATRVDPVIAPRAE